MKRPPTDFELLRAIYERHKGDYEARAATDDVGRIFVPIDIPAVAKDLGVDENSVFGCLYHHLEEIHGQKRDPNNPAPRKAFFHPRVGPDSAGIVNAVNFPLMETGIAGPSGSRSSRSGLPSRRLCCRFSRLLPGSSSSHICVSPALTPAVTTADQGCVRPLDVRKRRLHDLR